MSLPIEPIPQFPDPLDIEGSTARLRLDEDARTRSASRRTTPFQYLRDVQGELRRVAWPSRSQMLSYSSVVLITLVIMVSMIFGLSVGFRDLANYLLTP